MGSSVNLVKLGDKIRLNAQLSDSTDSLPKKVKADLRDKSGLILANLELSHFGGGLFKNSDFIMPQTEEITAQYRVYNEDDTVDKGYSSELDVFALSDSTGASSSTSNVVDSEYIVLYHNEKE